MDKQIDFQKEEETKSGLKVDNPMGRRIEYQKAFGTVKYCGPLKHDAGKHNDPNQIWLGVEWDDVSRGRHNGTVEGVKYFETENGQNSGTLLKAEKANFGINIYDGILLRYFNQKENKENKENAYVNEKGILVEYDDEAYFETVRKFKKRVEFLGFDKIWKKINDLKNLQELSLPECNISDLGPDGALEKLLPSMKNLSLEANLLYDWNQIYLIGKEMPHLEQLSISENRLNEPEEISTVKKLYINSNDTYIDFVPLGNIFQNLKTIILINMNLTWKTLNKILPLFFNVESLVICKNKLNDFENLTYTGADFKNLKFLNVEENNIKSFEGLLKFKDAPKLEKLILSKNEMSDLGVITGFEEVRTIVMEENNIFDFYIFNQLAQFPKLSNLRITKNPIATKYTPLHIRQRAIAEIKTLTQINGSELKKYERKDCEIYYLRDTFREFFEKTGQNPYAYKYDEFLEYCKNRHPRIPELIKIYGNPYEEVKGDEKSATDSTKPKYASMILLRLNALSGPCLGKPEVKKKFTDNTLITNLKAMLAKQFGIPAEKQRIYHKADPHDPFVPLDEDLKDLRYYGVDNGHEIWVGDEDSVL